MSLAIWDHKSVTCHQTQVNVHRLTRARKAGTQPTPEGWKAELM